MAMIRKMVIAGGGATLLGVALLGHEAFSYVKTSFGYVTGAVQDTVPIEFQIDRARGMVQDLLPEVRKNMHVIAKEEVEVERLDRQIAESQARLEKEKEQLLRLKTDIASGRGAFQYGGRSFTVEEVRTDLANRFDRYKTGEATLASLKDIRAAREKSLSAARQQLEGMLASKRQLQVEVENLEARTQMIAAAKATSDYQFDDSRLGKVKELVVGLRKRLEVSERLVNAEVHYQGEIPLDKSAPENIVEQVSDHFAPKKPLAEAKVAKK
jgi:chromosome segregation ATPase